MEHESDGDTNCNWYEWYIHQKNDNGTGGLENKRTSGDHPNDSIKISQNTEKSPGDLRKLAVTQKGEDHRLTLVWKTLKRDIIIKKPFVIYIFVSLLDLLVSFN